MGADFKLVPVNGSRSLLGAVGVAQVADKDSPLMTMGGASSNRRLGVRCEAPLATLHVGGDAIVDGLMGCNGIRIAAPIAPIAPIAPDRILQRIEALESEVARLSSLIMKRS